MKKMEYKAPEMEVVKLGMKTVLMAASAGSTTGGGTPDPDDED